MRLTINGKDVEIKPMYEAVRNRKATGECEILIECTCGRRLTEYEREKIGDHVHMLLKGEQGNV